MRNANAMPDAILTAAERAVAELVAQGLTSREIAAKLGCALPTIQAHIAAASRKIPGTGRPRPRITRHIIAGS